MYRFNEGMLDSKDRLEIMRNSLGEFFEKEEDYDLHNPEVIEASKLLDQYIINYIRKGNLIYKGSGDKIEL